MIQNSAPSSSSTGARISCNEANLVGVIEVAGAWFNVVFDGGHDTSQHHLDEAAPRCSPHCQLLSEVDHFAFRHNVGHFYLPLGHLVYRCEEVVVRVVVECSSESLSAWNEYDRLWHTCGWCQGWIRLEALIECHESDWVIWSFACVIFSLAGYEY